MIQINLLPWREQVRKAAQKRFGIIAACAAGLGVLLTVFFHSHYMFEISNQIKRNAMLQQALDQESAVLDTLNKQKSELTKIDQQLHFIYDLRDDSYRAVRLLNELAVTNPEAITLSKIVRIGNNIQIFGRAKSNLQITLFMESIEKSKYFNQPELTEISGKEGDTGEQREFKLKLQQQG